MPKGIPKNGINKGQFKKGIHYSPETEFKKGEKTHSPCPFPKGHIPWNFKGKRTICPLGYALILNHKHPFCDIRGYIYEHRLIAEKYLGRYLAKEERIHHLNGIRNDNHPENLYLFSTDRKHLEFHRYPIQLISNII